MQCTHPSSSFAFAKAIVAYTSLRAGHERREIQGTFVLPLSRYSTFEMKFCVTSNTIFIPMVPPFNDVRADCIASLGWTGMGTVVLGSRVWAPYSYFNGISERTWRNP